MQCPHCSTPSPLSVSHPKDPNVPDLVQDIHLRCKRGHWYWVRLRPEDLVVGGREKPSDHHEQRLAKRRSTFPEGVCSHLVTG
jgi:hypothetical protein